MYRGSCLCGAVRYRLLAEPERVSHCHCRMCQKQHGAAYATYATLPRQQLVYDAGYEELALYQSLSAVARRFCRHCGSNIEWTDSVEEPGWTAIAVASLDTPYRPAAIVDIFSDSAVCWLSRVNSPKA